MNYRQKKKYLKKLINAYTAEYRKNILVDADQALLAGYKEIAVNKMSGILWMLKRYSKKDKKAKAGCGLQYNRYFEGLKILNKKGDPKKLITAARSKLEF